MGGEHHVCFHGHGNPCSYIDCDSSTVNESKRDIQQWTILKQIILEFMISNNSKNELTNEISQIKSIKTPSEIKLYWSYRDDINVIGKVMHDIVKLMMITYPGKVCACFDRCSYFTEFPGQEWDMCKCYRGIYDNIPKFHLFVLPDISNEYQPFVTPIFYSHFLSELTQ